MGVGGSGLGAEVPVREEPRRWSEGSIKHGDYVAEVGFDSEGDLFRARVVNLERDSFDFCASSIDELHQEFARSVGLYEEICRERGPRAGEAEAALLTNN